jgi:hypothetical protein
MFNRTLPLSRSTALLALFLAQFCVPAFAAPKGGAQPEQIVELYLAAFVNADVEKAAQLNDILRPAFSGQDALDISAIKNMSDEVADRITTSSLQKFPENKRAAMKEPFTRMNKAVLAAVNRSQCKATSTAMRKNEYVADRRIATVSFECKIADTASGFAALTKPAKGSQPTPALVDAITKVFNDAPLTRRMTGKMDLYEDKSGGKSSLWVTGSPGEAYGEVLGEVAGEIGEFVQ